MSNEDYYYEEEPYEPDPLSAFVTMRGQSFIVDGNELVRVAAERLGKIDPFEHADEYSWDDLGTSTLFAEVFKDFIAYCPTAKSWYTWEDTRWVADEGDIKIANYMVGLVELLKRYVLLIANEDFSNAKVENYEKYVRKLYAKRTRDVAIEDAERLVDVPISRFDAKPELINTLEGTYNLETGRLHEPTKDDWITQSTNFAFSSEAKCERWESFLHEMTGGDDELLHYLQRAMGYSIFGEAVEDCMFILYGKSTRNGKSTFLGAIQDALGDYATTMPPEFVCSIGAKSEYSNPEAANPALANLRAKRLVIMSEPKAGYKLNEGFIKSLTGGEQIQARMLYGRPFTFTPNFTMWMSCNDLPDVRDRSLFSSGRIKVIELNHHVPENKRDNTLRRRFAAEESKAAIFNWLVQGYKDYKRLGLSEPDSVRKVTRQYAEDNDVVALFASEVCLRDESAKEKCSLVYQKFRRWCDANGMYCNLNATKFHREMERVGWKRFDSNGNSYYRGLMLR